MYGTFKTRREAEEKARELREIFGRECPVKFVVLRPRWNGDAWAVGEETFR
ncbi:hypothetical protein UFOVP452_8 [uncultured Caudovirales phage]|uniref:Uncharacterized protein n=1 Tax=uncultured Caudovirales phage TaxID=2100421 RepID=A0A6J5MB80_9CAUD|nr:hypothetical protein UFOVP452_8 [uncultured Caudovirales phage]